MVVGSYSYPFQFQCEYGFGVGFRGDEAKVSAIFLYVSGNKITHDKFVVVADVFTSKCVAALYFPPLLLLSVPFCVCISLLVWCLFVEIILNVKCGSLSIYLCLLWFFIGWW